MALPSVTMEGEVWVASFFTLFLSKLAFSRCEWQPQEAPTVVNALLCSAFCAPECVSDSGHHGDHMAPVAGTELNEKDMQADGGAGVDGVVVASAVLPRPHEAGEYWGKRGGEASIVTRYI